jgi:nucleoid-associated protein YgaU
MSKTVVQAGGNLFAMAAREYGDPLLWTRIAAANGLYDPEIQGLATLVVPAAPIDGSVPDGIRR